LFWRFAIIVAFGIFVISIFWLTTTKFGGHDATHRNETRSTVR
jgi:hypothetical protein